MHLTAIILLAFCIQVSAGVNAQNINFSARNVRLETAFNVIKKQTDYSVVWNRDILKIAKPITVSAENISLVDFLNLILKGQAITYSINEKVISIRRTTSVPELNLDVAAAAVYRDVTGVVKDGQGNPLAGVSVAIAGGKGAVVTDDKGNFKIAVPENAVLSFSYVGYKTVTVAVKDSPSLEITLTLETSSMNDVVVVGYGSMKRSDVTGSISSIKGTALESQPNYRTDEAIQGRISGVLVQNNSGGPTPVTSIRIRGANSLTFGNDPLIIVDGIQNLNLSNINPNDIKSIEVLKDAAALSIYGSRGANGVVLVTTKSGTTPLSIAYNAFFSQDRVRKALDFQNATQYGNLVNEAQLANGYNPILTPGQIAALGKGTDWQNEIFRNALTQSHNLSISGTSENINYYISGNYIDRDGIIINSDYRAYSLRANLVVKASRKLTFTFNAFAQNDKSRDNAASLALRSAVQWSPTKSVYDSLGRYTQPGGGIGPNGIYNPVGLAKESVADVMNKIFAFAPSAEFKFSKNFSVKALLAYRENNAFSGFFDNQVVNQGPASAISGSVNMSTFSSIQSTNYLTYTGKIKDHSFNFTAVYEALKNQSRNVSGAASGIPVNLGYNGLSYATTTPYPQPNNGIANSASQSFMGRLNYSYKDRYLISLSDRYDGASQLSEGNKYENFPAVAVGWNIINESFAENWRHIAQELKLRASYGSVGNAAVPAYSSQGTFYPSLDANGNPTLTIKQLPNAGLKWERTTEKNLGVDAAFLNARLQFTAEVYDKLTENLLIYKEVPAALGVGSILTNVGSVSNKGYEFSIGGTPVSTNKIRWQTNVIYSANRNKIMALAGTDTVYNHVNDFPGVSGSFALIKGQPMGSFLGYRFAGIWGTHEASTAALYGAKPGDGKYVDVNGDGVINSQDITNIGSAQPKFNFGWNNDLVYKGFELNIFIQGVYGNSIYNETAIQTSGTSSRALNYWTTGNQNTITPSLAGKYFSNSSYWVEDGSYIRLKNVSIGYRFSENQLRRLGILSSLRIFVSSKNLITITDYSGYDPEAATGVDANGGVDLNIYPSTRSYTIGLDLKFN